MSQENVEIVRRLNEAFNRGDIPAVLELLDPGIEWWDREDDPGATVHRGLEGFSTFAAELYEQVEIEVEVKEYIDTGDYVVTSVRVHGRGRSSGAPFEEHEFHVARLLDGKLTEVREYRSRAEAFKAVGLSE